MQVVALKTLRLFWEGHPRSERPIRSWYAQVRAANWTGPSAVKEQFGSMVDFVADNRIIFDLGGNKYRLVVRVSYKFGRVLVKFVGTHAEYDRINPERIR